MALATNTQPGEIQLAGDLAGNNDATAPALSPSGVTAGQYILPQLTVDGKGRITNAQGSNPSSISALLQNASSTQKGVVQAGNGLDVTTNDAAGYQEITFTTLIDGTEATGLDTCASYLIDINIDALATQSIIVSGNVVTIQDVIDEINLTLSGGSASIISGVIRITSNTTGQESLVEIVNDALFGCMTDFVSIDPFVRGYADCEMYAEDATTSSKGIVQIGSGIDVTAGVISIAASSLPPATPTTLGGVIVPASGNLDIDVSGNISVPISDTAVLGVIQVPGGDGLSVDGSGSLTFDGTQAADATTSSKGVVQIGNNIDVSSGVISVAEATAVDLGVVQIGNNIDVSNGSISIPEATTSSLGVVQIGSGIDVSSGVISVNLSSIPDATTSSKGMVQIGNNIDVSSGVISVAEATTSSLGVVQVGSGLNVSAGVISVDTTSYPDATTSSKGLVQIGNNIDVSSGIISVAEASAVDFGVVQIGNNIDVSSGVISVAEATAVDLGVVQIGNNIDVSSGVISVAEATTSSKGVVQIGNNIDVSSGVISVADASGTTTKGIVKSADANNITITAGDIDVGTNIAKLDTANTYTKAQVVSQFSSSATGTINPDLSVTNSFKYTLIADTTLSTPTNGVAGGTYLFVISNSAGYNFSFSSDFKFKSGVVPDLTGTIGLHLLSCVYDGSNYYTTYAGQFA